MGALDGLLNAKGLIRTKDLQRLAGQLAWASGLFPFLRSFNGCLWSALAANAVDESKRHPKHLVFVLRVAHALRWIAAALHGGVTRVRGGVQRNIQAWISLPPLRLQTDASPYGFGGILFKSDKPVAFFAEAISEFDLSLFGAELGDSKWQAEWELYCILLAVHTWQEELSKAGVVVLQADAMAALHVTARQAGRTSAMNSLAAEVSIRLERCGCTIVPLHFRAALNVAADALSRVALGYKLPEGLAHVARVHVQPRSPDFFLAWPRDLVARKRCCHTCAHV
eukprot:6490334-Amphidinium_carterae.1